MQLGPSISLGDEQGAYIFVQPYLYLLFFEHSHHYLDHTTNKSRKFNCIKLHNASSLPKTSFRVHDYLLLSYDTSSQKRTIGLKEKNVV